ncbi:MAG TPA: hypothetical protein VGM05_32475 [Planctomycetaceae bacterium]|jgi:hypothetical protein
MLTVNLRLMFRQSFVVLCSSLVLAMSPGAARAEPAENPVRQAKGEGEPAHHTGFGDILQTAGKASGKNAHSANEPKGLPDLEAKGASDSTSRKAAIAAIPLDTLSAENRQKVAGLLKSVSFYRRLPKVTFPVEPEVYNYFLAHPDVAVSIWRAMKISKLQMWQTGKFDYEADTGDGSIGTLEVLHIGAEKSLVACDGLYKTAMLSKPIAAKSLLFLQTSFAKQPDGTIHVTHRADLFVSFPSQTIDVVARIFSPLTVKMTDRTFTEISLFLKMMSTAMTRRPDWVEHITEKMEGIPDLRKGQVLELSTQLYTAARVRESEQEETDDAGSAKPQGAEGTDSQRRRADAAGDRRSSANDPSSAAEPASVRVTSAEDK